MHRLTRLSVPALKPLLALFMASGMCFACDSDDDNDTAKQPADKNEDAGEEAGAVGPVPEADWVRLGYDLGSTYNNTAEKIISVDNVDKLEVLWTFDVITSPTSTPLIVGDRLYVLATGVYCFDLESGDKCWENVNISGSSTLAYDDGVLFLHDSSGVLHALDSESGEQIWEYDPSDHPVTLGFSSPIVSGDIVLVGGSSGEVTEDAATFRGYVVAVDKKTGEELWRRHTVTEEENGASVWSTVSVDEEAGLVFASTGNNYRYPASDTSDAILAISMEDDHDFAWKAQAREGDVYTVTMSNGNPDFDFGANPVLFEVEDGDATRKLVAAGQKSGDIHVLDRDDGGAEVCKRNLSPGNSVGSAGIFNNTSWDGKHVLVAANSATSEAEGSLPKEEGNLPTSVLFAIDPLSCEIVWERQLPSVVMGPITVANGVGFVGTNATLDAFDVETGQRLFDYETSATIASGAAVSNGRVAFGSGLPWFFGSAGNLVHVLSLPKK